MKRAGSCTVAIDIWHLDVEDFLEMQTESGDMRKKSLDVFPQLVVSDEFMRRVENNEDWTLLDPYEIKTKLGFDLTELWGDDFTNAYTRIEEEFLNELVLVKKVNAKSLFKKIMRCQIETGLPYLFFKDTVNRANPNKHLGYIPSGNLCVAPETKILTDKGQIEIATLEGQFVNAWNGSEWSNVMVKKTGENQPLLKINFSNGESLDCTYYHKFWVQDTYKSKPRQVEAKDLKPGDKLIKYELPVVSSPDDIEFPYAYTSGVFSGDGVFDKKRGYSEVYLYGEKKKLVSHLAVRNKMQNTFQGTVELEQLAIYNDVSHDRLVCKLPSDILPKFTVPLNGYTVKSRLEWLAGLLDTDGTVSRNGSNESFMISSVHKQFLLEVKLLLQTLGIDSKVTKVYDSRTQLMPDGKGGQKEYQCKEAYRLLINSNGLYQLGQLGLVTHRLKWESRKPQREASQFIKVESVDLTGRISDTYCFNEPLRHLGMFNGILTGQCQEQYSIVSADKYASCCNLISLNLANIDSLSDLAISCEMGVRILDNAIDLTTPPIPEAKAHNDMFRTIGVGVMGLADWLAKRKLKYSNLTEISHLFEDFGYYCTHASMSLARERGTYKAFIGSEWDKGLLVNSKSLEEIQSMSYSPERWTQLHKDICLYGIRNSHITAIAPNTSSSLVQGCTASVLPVYSRFFYNSAKGSVPIAPPFINDYFWYYQENKNLDQQEVVRAVATIQQWIDTGISMELVFNPNLEGFDAKTIFDVLMLAWKMGCKAIYYVRSIQKHDIGKEKNECSSCAN